MDIKRYRIGIKKEKMLNWRGWYSDYELESDVAIRLADALAKDLEKFGIYRVKPNAEITPEKRRQIFKTALMHLAKKYSI